MLDDARHGRLEKFYRSTGRTDLRGLRPDRSIFRGKHYLPIGLVEAGRGCHFKCDFCSVQTVFSQSQTCRPADEISAELRTLKDTKKLFFFRDDIHCSRSGTRAYIARAWDAFPSCRSRISPIP